MNKSSAARRIDTRYAAVCAPVLCLLWAAAAWAQDAPAPPADAAPLTVEGVQERRAAFDADGDLDEDTRKKADEFYAKALEALRGAHDHAAKSKEHVAALTAAPKETERVRAELAEEPEPAPPAAEQAQGRTLEEVEAQERQAEAAAAEAQSELAALEDELTRQQARPVAIRAALVEAGEQVTELTGTLGEPAPVGEAAAVTEARRLWLRARMQLREAEQRMLAAEQESYDVRLALLTERRNLAAAHAKRVTEAARGWKAVALERRQEAARRQTAELAAQAAELRDLPDAVRAIAEGNVELAERIGELVALEAAVAARLEKARARRDEIRKEFEVNAGRIELAARSETVGLLLRRQRATLPDVRAYQRASLSRRDEVAELVASQIEIDQEQRDLLRDVTEAAEAVVDDVEPRPEGARRAELIERAVELQEDRLELLGKLYAAQSGYISDLNELDLVEQEMTDTARRYAALIDTNLLWLRSAPPIRLRTLSDVPSAVGWLASGRNWRALGAELWADVRRLPGVWALGLGGAAVLILMRRRARRRLVEISTQVGRVSTDSFVLTLRALLLTAVAAAGWAALAGFVGWRLRVGIDSGLFARAIGAGLIAAAALWVTLAVIREVCDRGGLGVAHFRWPEAARAAVRGQTVWLIALVVPASFLAAVMNASEENAYVASVGRIAYIVAMIGLAVFVARVASPRGPVAGALIRRTDDGWLAKLRWLWFPLAVGLPLGLAALSGFGYTYTAAQLSWRLLGTIWLVLVLIIIHATLLRALFVAARRLAFAEAKRRREEERRRREEEADEEEEDADEPPPIEVPEISVDQISDHTRKLVQMLIAFTAFFGLWLAWADALPALTLLDQIRIAGTPVTVGMLALCVIALIVTFVAARNLPGVLEITLLNRLPLDAGARYAVVSLSRYVIVGVGLVAAFNALGVRWDNIQWLIAALGVGLGFGLQEIVANFVSGLIILFERPFRVGDFVTVNDVEGWVTRIRIRATTISTLERRELIVPNKEFITGQIINWSLSDPIIRISVPVGIVYGADTELAEKLFLEAARENEDVLESPEPKALFLGFGDNSLNFDVRIWIDDVATRYDVIHELHKAIDRKCREHGVVIAFPQRDIHLDQAGPLKIQFERPARRRPDEGSAPSA